MSGRAHRTTIVRLPNRTDPEMLTILRPVGTLPAYLDKSASGYRRPDPAPHGQLLDILRPDDGLHLVINGARHVEYDRFNVLSLADAR